MSKENVPHQQWAPMVSPAVVAVLIAAVAVFVIRITIPNLFSPPEYAVNETKAIEALRTLGSAQHLYHARYKVYTTLEVLHSVHAIDLALAKATTPENAKDGYYFRIEPGKDQWKGVALPAQPGKTGKRSFYMDHMAVIRQAKCESTEDPPANPTSPEVD